MRAKTLLLTMLFLAVSFTAFSQEYKKEIRKGFNAYNRLLISERYDEAFDYLNDDFLQLFPKKQLIEEFKSITENDVMSVKIVDPSILEVYDREKIEKNYYVILVYSNILRTSFKLIEDETAEQYSLRMAEAKKELEALFGIENVKYDKDETVFNVYTESKVVATSINGDSNWKYLVIDPSIKFVYERILPKTIVQKAFQ